MRHKKFLSVILSALMLVTNITVAMPVSAANLTADNVIATAKAEEGYLEKASSSSLDSKTANAGSANYTKYARDLRDWTGASNVYVNGLAWCDYFVDWCMVKTYGVTTAKKLIGGWSGYTPTSAQYYKDMGQWHTSSPQKGDQIFFKNSRRICHTGLVYKVTSGTVYTVEGNTSSAAGVVANGGCVRLKSYSTSYSRIAGYGRPAYAKYLGSSTPAQPALAITGQPQGATVEPNTLHEFDVKTNRNDTQYQWQVKEPNKSWRDFTEKKTSKTAGLNFTITSDMDNWQLRCRVSAGGSTQYSNTVTIHVNQPIAFTQQPASVTVKAGTLHEFDVKTNRSDAVYQWQIKEPNKSWRDFTEKKTAATAGLNFTITDNMNGWKLRCRASASGKTVYSNEATITIQQDLAVKDEPKDTVAEPNRLKEFSVTVNHPERAVYQWQVLEPGKNWRDFTEKKTAATQTVNFTITDQMNGWKMRCHIKNGSQEVYSDPFTLTVAHTWNSSYTTDVKATYTTEGRESIHCSICGTVKPGSERSIPKVAHTHAWDNGKTTEEPGCETEGVKTYTCTLCGETKTETIPALGHDWSDWVNNQRTCRRCGKTESRSGFAFTTQPKEETVEAGKLHAYTAKVNEDGAKYQWQVSEDGGKNFRDFTEKKTAATPTVNFTITDNMNGWLIRCSASKDGETIYSDAVKITTAAKKELVPIYRVYNRTTGEHLYTASAGEKNALVKSGWTDEGTAWNTPKKSNIPVYRVSNPSTGEHHFTTSAGEKNSLIKAGWNDEGIAWYASESKTKAIYRMYNKNLKVGAHVYTASAGERDALKNSGWVYEGIAWYAE